MRVLYGLEAVEPPFTQSVLTIGNFDGVHRAHQQLLAQAGLFAANTGGPVVVLTFDPHPLSIVAPARTPPRLSTLEQKLGYLARLGVDVTVVAKSERSLLDLEASTFVDRIIRQRFHPTHLVEGPSFGFGRGRQGTPDTLRRLTASFDCEVHIVEPVTLQVQEGKTLLVSSSLIRRLIGEGMVRRAALCLGRYYELIGKVVKGAGRGRKIGFPTANIAEPPQLVPADGVYAGRAFVSGESHPCAVSIGTAPTFAVGERTIEAHLLGFAGDVYGEEIHLEFAQRLRAQRTFSSPEALREQLKRDVAAVPRGLQMVEPVDSEGDAAGQ
ncbi:MAG: bifunctional riboflavin kinase/FAD synthetase [Phycisphaerae bacterium]